MDRRAHLTDLELEFGFNLEFDLLCGTVHLSPHTLSKFGMSSHIDQQHSFFLQSTSTNSGQQTSTRSTPEHVTLGPKLLSQCASRARTGTGRGEDPL